MSIARHLFSKLSGRGEIVIIEGTPASATSRERLNGFREALADYPDIRVRLSLSGDYQRDVARAAFADTIDQLPNVDAVLCANDHMALGVLDVLGSVAGHREMLVVGVNAIPEAIAAIEAGRMYGLRLEGTWMHVGAPAAITAAEQAILASVV